MVENQQMAELAKRCANSGAALVLWETIRRVIESHRARNARPIGGGHVHVDHLRGTLPYRRRVSFPLCSKGIERSQPWLSSTLPFMW